MSRDENAKKGNTEAGDVRVEVLEEVLSALERFPDSLRMVRVFIAEQLAPENDPAIQLPASPIA